MNYTTYTDSKGDLYGQFFLYNNDMNNAGDPINFKVYPENNDKIAKSFIGRPYVLPPRKNGKWDTTHVRAETLDELLNKQKKLAAGEIVDVIQNKRTGNFNAVVKFFPEYYDQIKKGDIPEYTSPMFAHTDSYIDDEGKLHIKDGMGVHLHAVPRPGYPPEISGIKSICEGGLNECMNELKIVAAAGQLAEFQSDESFSNVKNQESQSNMSMQQPQQAPPAQAPPAQDNNLETRVAAIEKVLKEIIAKLTGAQPAVNPPTAGAAAESVQVTEGKQTEDVTTLQAELNQIKAEREAEKLALQKERESLQLKERTRLAAEIVESKIKLHRLPIEARDSEIKKLVDMKVDEQPADLTLLNAELKESLKALVGASYGFPEFGLEEDQNAETNYIAAMEDIGQ